MGISVVSYTIKDIRDEEVCDTLYEINCCGASVASEQHYKQDLRKIYRRGEEFSN